MNPVKINQEKKWNIGDNVFTLQYNHIYYVTITNIEHTINGWWYVCSNGLKGLECMFSDTVDDIISRLTSNIKNEVLN